MRTFDSLQVLRFVGALLVVVYHVQPGHGDSTDFESFFAFVHNGGAGVDIFFVISGFIITMTVMRKPVFAMRAFALNRFFRIYPTYWLFLTLAIVLGYLSFRLTGSSGTWTLMSPSSAIASYLLAPLPTQIYPVAWTLTLEVSFYLIFCLSYRVAGLGGVIVSLLAWYALARVGAILLLDPAAPFVWFFHSVVLEFLYGVLIAAVWFRYGIKWSGLAFGLGAVAFAAAVGGWFEVFPVGREFRWGLPAALLIYGAVGLTWKAPRMAILAGDSSYILYLMHPLLITAVKVLALRLMGIDVFESNLAACVIILLSVLVAMGLTYWVERPYITWYKGLIARWSGRREEAAPKGQRHPNPR